MLPRELPMLAGRRSPDYKHFKNNDVFTYRFSNNKAGRRIGVVLHSPVPGPIRYLGPVDRKVRRAGATLGVIRRQQATTIVD